MNLSRPVISAVVLAVWLASVPASSSAQGAAAPKDDAEAFGTLDTIYDVELSADGKKLLRRAGKSSQLIVYKDLEHDLRDSNVRADVLRKSDEFLRKNLKL